MKKQTKKIEENNNVCKCGCGENLTSLKRAQRDRGYEKGDFPQFIRGHNSKGKNNPMFGKKYSEEHLKKLSKSHIGYIMPEFQKIKISKSLKGKNTWSKGKKRPEISGKNHPMYGKKGINHFNYGLKRTEITLQKLKESRKNRIIPIKDTTIELKIQKYLSDLHIEYVTHKYISEITHGYQCDIFIPKQETEGIIISQKTIIEADGCYWHGCPVCKQVKNNIIGSKIDEIRTKELINKGFKVIRLWEHDIRKLELNEFKERLINIV